MRERAAELSPLLREIVAAAALGCEELSVTIEQLLDLTRIEAGQLRLNLDRVDLLALAGMSPTSSFPVSRRMGFGLTSSVDATRRSSRATSPGSASSFPTFSPVL
jgi:NtrC-family two-component system sensor histidine kinase KinB